MLDLIRHAITGKGERLVWKRLKEQHPELEELVDRVSFRDAVGRLKNGRPELDGWWMAYVFRTPTVGSTVTDRPVFAISPVIDNAENSALIVREKDPTPVVDLEGLTRGVTFRDATGRQH